MGVSRINRINLEIWKAESPLPLYSCQELEDLFHFFVCNHQKTFEHSTRHCGNTRFSRCNLLGCLRDQGCITIHSWHRHSKEASVLRWTCPFFSTRSKLRFVRDSLVPRFEFFSLCGGSNLQPVTPKAFVLPILSAALARYKFYYKWKKLDFLRRLLLVYFNLFWLIWLTDWSASFLRFFLKSELPERL